MIRFRLLFFLAIIAFSANAQKTGAPKKELTDKGHSGGFMKSHTPHARDFHSIGHSLFFDLNLGPLKSYQVIRNQDTTYEYSRLVEYSLYHISYFLRFNVIQPDDDHAFTFTLNPGIGLGMSQSKKLKGFGIFNGGAYLGWESGAGSTYRTGEEKGRFIRIGAEYNYTPLIISNKSSDNQDIQAWINPVISFGFRKENAKQNLVETNIKIGFGLKAEDPTIASNTLQFYRPFSLRFSMAVFLDH